MTACLLKSRGKSCCCRCEHQVQDRRFIRGKLIRLGLVCLGFAHEGVAVSGMPKHSLCELFKERK